MPTYKKCPEEVLALAREVMCEFPDHKPLLDARVKIDFLFAFPDYDDATGDAKNDAIKYRGNKALGLCRILKLKDRAKGMGDAEILLDGDWFGGAAQEEARSLLDHELYHLAVKLNASGAAMTDDLNRPKLVMRRHDVEVGWFSKIAARHPLGVERQSAKQLMDNFGQYFWPELAAK